MNGGQGPKFEKSRFTETRGGPKQYCLKTIPSKHSEPASANQRGPTLNAGLVIL